MLVHSPCNWRHGELAWAGRSGVRLKTRSSASGGGLCSHAGLSANDAAVHVRHHKATDMPGGPTRLVESSTSMPPLDPRSSTVSPGFSSASAVWLPQPSEASTAADGRSATSSTGRQVAGNHALVVAVRLASRGSIGGHDARRRRRQTEMVEQQGRAPDRADRIRDGAPKGRARTVRLRSDVRRSANASRAALKRAGPSDRARPGRRP